MAYSTARSNFQNAKTKTEDAGVREIADGLVQLSRAIESDLSKLEREISALKNQLR